MHTDRFIKYVWSVFFFVLTVNMLGLLPIPSISAFFGIHLGGTATGNIWVTATLALMTLVLMVVNGLRFGGMDYIKHFCPGPLWLAPLLIPVEIIGLFAKTFALAVRLFANMIAGHILLGVLLGLILAAGQSLGTGGGLAVGAVGRRRLGRRSPCSRSSSPSCRLSSSRFLTALVHRHVGQRPSRRARPRGRGITRAATSLSRRPSISTSETPATRQGEGHVMSNAVTSSADPRLDSSSASL